MYHHLYTHAVTRKLRSSLLLLALLSISPASFGAQDPNDKYFISNPLVLLTGVTDYKAGISNLPTVKDEMKIFHTLFTTQCGYETYGTCLDKNHRVKDKFSLSKDDLEQFIQEKKDYLAQNVDKFDALIFVFSGHGSGDIRGNDTICTSDGETMYFAQIKKQFTDIRGLGNHPKLFFKLACRGSSRSFLHDKSNLPTPDEDDEKSAMAYAKGSGNRNNKTANSYTIYATSGGYTAGTTPGVDIANSFMNDIGPALGKDTYAYNLASIMDNVKQAISQKYDNDRVEAGGTLPTTKVFFKWGVPTVVQQIIDKHESFMIMEALKLGNTDFVNYLVANGKGIALKQTHMDYACKNGDLTLVQYLVSKDVPLKQAHMEQACGSLNLALVKYLENKGLQATHYHLKNPQLLRTLHGHTGWVRSVAYSPDGKQLASASSDETLKFWDLATGACVRTLEGHRDEVNGVAYSPDGQQLAVASYDKTLKIWDFATGKCVRTLSGETRETSLVQLIFSDSKAGHTGWVSSVAYSSHGKQLACGSHKTLKLWDLAIGKCVRTLSGHTDDVNGVAYSPDGKELASASDDKTLKLWDLATGKCVRTLEGHTNRVRSVAYSPDGKQLASASGGWLSVQPADIKLWDPATGACQHTLCGHTGEVLCVAYAWTGRQLAAGSCDNTIKLWGSR